MTKKLNIFIFLLVFTVLFIFLWGCKADPGRIITDDEPKIKAESIDSPVPGRRLDAGDEERVSLDDENDSWQLYSLSEKKEPVEEIGVYICGAVKSPGVYYLKDGARLVDLVKAAGGFKKNAARTYLNQAAYLKDGQKIKILTKKQAKKLKNGNGSDKAGEENDFDSGSGGSDGYGSDSGGGSDDSGSSSGPAEDGLINLNTAEKKELMSLEGIGESKADAIISYRNKQGKFESIEDIMKVSGIKAGTFNKIKDKIKI